MLCPCDVLMAYPYNKVPPFVAVDQMVSVAMCVMIAGQMVPIVELMIPATVSDPPALQAFSAMERWERCQAR